MEYREYGSTGKKLSGISFGGNRFPAQDLQDEAGLCRCVDLIEKAAVLGINYFDTAHYYCNSKSEEIFRRAYKRLRDKRYSYYTSAKSGSNTDETADEVLRRAETSLKNMDLGHIDFFYMWGIKNEEEYQFIMRKGGPYEGAVKAKEQGLIQHIVFSSHMPPEAACKVIGDEVFEGITISYSLLNYPAMQKVIELAGAKRMGIAVMNPLAGGIIPQNKDYFANKLYIPAEQVITAAHAFIYSHPEITTILSGIENEKQLFENVNGLEDTDIKASLSERLPKTGLEDLKMCTGCGYCRGCPCEIPIPFMMQAYNKLLFHAEDLSHYHKTDGQLLKQIAAMKQLTDYHHYLPESEQNPCIQCGKCESNCTQKLPVRERLAEVYHMIKTTGASRRQHRERLDKLLNKKGYGTVAFYTAGGYTHSVLTEYTAYFGKPAFDVILLDKNSLLWGTSWHGYPILPPDQIPSRKPDCIFIPSYRFGAEIYEELKSYKNLGIDIVLLHEDGDVPWIY